MSGPRISAIEFDESSLVRRSAEIEQERRVAMFDLIEDNVFKPLRAFAAGHEGPYKLRMAVNDGRLQLDILADGSDELLESFILGLAKFRRPVREYFAICDSYNKAVRRASAHEIESIDMARRGIHDHAAEMLLERLDGKVETDFATARRLFTLICVLHIRA
ncbi:UPF0262 family protein [Novosphingobium sp. TH158]|uniref:UPF0262 family protein n=1 Tax=Novosphingobium sp. TH158 TaxID=2067455 RepID=UPI000C7BB4C1|nr:UPF0262 family protein [Novosphingobium sp. TH158]PLK26877.1 hypothetical protein C0V78_08230 [Novosphingobium sp. TH158]